MKVRDRYYASAAGKITVLLKVRGSKECAIYVFSGGKMPYGGLSPLSLSKLLKDGERMLALDNAACSQEMYIISQ